MGLAVLDATGKIVGPFVTEVSFDQDAVALKADEGPGLAPIIDDFFFLPNRSPLFESADCSGPPLLSDENPSAIPRASSRIGGTVYFPRGGSYSVITIGSSEREASLSTCTNPGEIFIPPNKCCCTSPTCKTVSPTRVDPAGTIDVTGFVPPFRVELR